MALLYNLTNGIATDWMDLSPFSDAFEYQGNVTGAVTILLEVSNDPTAAKADVVAADTYTISFAKVATWPLPRFARLRMSAGSGSAVVSFGPSKTLTGFSSSVAPIPTSNKPSNLFS